MSASEEATKIREQSHPLHAPQSLDPLMARIGDARYVLIGEASHGTSEFYRWRAELTKRLIAEKDFSFDGLDVYSLWDSLDEILAYLREHEPEGTDAALGAYRCFEPYREDPQGYAFATRMLPETCENAVVQLLSQRVAAAAERPALGLSPSFVARQTAEVVAG